MPKYKPKLVPKSHSMSKLTHAQCRQKVCLICFEHKSSVRVISEQANFQAWNDHLRRVVGKNFDIHDQRQPDAICNNCRLKYFSSKAIEENKTRKTFNIPQYLQFVVAPQNKDEVCDCDICLKVRQGPDANNPGLKPGSASHAGGRPRVDHTPPNTLL